MTLVHSWICRHENIKGILDVQLWELGTQRLHQGLSETILVNTLTDIREFKNPWLISLYVWSASYIKLWSVNITRLEDRIKLDNLLF